MIDNVCETYFSICFPDLLNKCVNFSSLSLIDFSYVYNWNTLKRFHNVQSGFQKNQLNPKLLLVMLCNSIFISPLFLGSTKIEFESPGLRRLFEKEHITINNSF